jgi:Ca-activated chloride channel family protein
MRRAVSSAIFLVASGIAFSAQAVQQPAVFRATGDAVRVDVTVTRTDGSLVNDLTVDAFEVLDNGRPQRIAAFQSGIQPVTISTILDLSESNIDAVPDMEAGALALISALRPGDRAHVASLESSGGSLGGDADSLRRDLSALELDNASRLWPRLERSAHLLRSEQGRRAILIATDGFDLGDWLMAFAPENEAINQLRGVLVQSPTLRPFFLSEVRNGLSYRGIDDDAIQLYVVQTGGRIMPDMRKVAEGSGGRVIDGRKGRVDDVFPSVLEELRRQYVVAFEPPERDGAVHRIEVRLKTAGLRARHRGAYVATK